jgi:sterol desaturase/sphingolipid hydroxylase (fatty acid hydroxylase superfamily)
MQRKGFVVGASRGTAAVQIDHAHGAHAHPRRAPQQKDLKTYKREQARKSLKNLYGTTIFYGTYGSIILYLALRSPHPIIAVPFYVVGLWSYTLIEYLAHRWMFHYQFKNVPGVEGYLYRIFESVHNGHHANPLDGDHISGRLRDLMPLFIVAAPLSFIAPVYTLPVLLGGNVQGYVITEWIHHCMHFYRFRDPYFRYARRHHFYHHSPKGVSLGYGVTNGFWDIIFRTRYPKEVRWALHYRPKGKPLTYMED